MNNKVKMEINVRVPITYEKSFTIEKDIHIPKDLDGYENEAEYLEAEHEELFVDEAFKMMDKALDKADHMDFEYTEQDEWQYDVD